LPKSKTAISIESSLLLETDTVAKELEIPRSQIVSEALIEYLNQYRNRQLLAKINAVYAGEPDPEDIDAMKIIHSHQKKQGKSEEWK
jgi:metal-responsive CopG/Arc/MetJ family transcriptional regulator